MKLLINTNGLPQNSDSPEDYPTLSHFVAWHFGQGGRVSVLSSNLITSPHFLHLYDPLPGFSPVVCIINQFKKRLKNKNKLLAAFFHRTNLNLFRYCGLGSSGSFLHRNKLSRSRISNACRCFAHKYVLSKLKIRFHHKGLKTYPIIIDSPIHMGNRDKPNQEN